MDAQQPVQQTRTPTWLNVLIVAVAMLLTAWLGYEYLIKDTAERKMENVAVDPSSRARPQPIQPAQPGILPPRAPQALRPGTLRLGRINTPNVRVARPFERLDKRNGRIYAQRGDAILVAAAGRAGIEILSFDWTPAVRQSWLSPADQQTLSVVQDIATRANVAREARATADQIRKAKAAITINPLTAEDTARLLLLLKAWDDASPAGKVVPYQQLLTAVADIGAARMAGAKDALAAGLKAATSILSPQQIQLAKAYLDSPAPPPQRAVPATRPVNAALPATRPANAAAPSTQPTR